MTNQEFAGRQAVDAALAELRGRLQSLRRSDGEPSLREIVRRTHQARSHTTVKQVLDCRRSPPWGALELVVEALKGDSEEFRSLWIRVRDAEAPLPGSGGTNHEGRGSTSTSAPLEGLDEGGGSGPGKYFADLDPFHFGVHRASNPGSAAADLSDLPLYVRRPHDDDLGRRVADASAGRSSVVMLIGRSSVGKTRSAWEALAASDPGWRVWQPRWPSHVEALLQNMQDAAPYTVIWLDNANLYFPASELGERVAAGLRDLVADRGRGPILVLGTIWPLNWERLTRFPEDGEPDAVPQARQLLDGADVVVPESFDTPALMSLEHAAKHDPRLMMALQQASQARITQYLAGVPALLRHYRQAGPSARALIHVAMDARHLDVTRGLPLAFLAEAAPGYFADVEWSEISAREWVTEGLTYAKSARKGVPGPLAVVADRDQGRGGEPAYRLADYLAHLASTEREAWVPPASFWTAAERSLPAEDLARLAERAKDRGLYRISAGLYRAAFLGGTPVDLSDFLEVLAVGSRESLRTAASWMVENVSVSGRLSTSYLHHALRERSLKDLSVRLRMREATEAPVGSFRALGSAIGRMTGAPLQVLLARIPVARVRLDAVPAVLELIRALDQAGAQAQATELAQRLANANEDLDIPVQALTVLNEHGSSGVRSIAERLVSQADLADRGHVLAILSALERIDEPALGEPLRVHLAQQLIRDAQLVDVADAYDCLRTLQMMWGVGATDAVDRLAARLRAHLAELMPRESAYRYVTDVDLRVEPELVLSLLGDLGPEDVESLSQGVWVLLDAHVQAGDQAWVASVLGRALDDHIAAPRTDRLKLLMRMIREFADPETAAALTSRLAALHPLADGACVVELLQSLPAANRPELLERPIGTEVRLADANTICALIDELNRHGSEEVSVLAARDPAHMTLHDAHAAAALLTRLTAAQATEPTLGLATRAAAKFGDEPGPAGLELAQAMYTAGAAAEGAALLKAMVSATDLGSPAHLTALILAARELAPDLLQILLARDLGGQVRFGRSGPHQVAPLLRLLKALDRQDHIRTLAARIVTDMPLSYRGLGSLPDTLRQVGEEAVAARLSRRAMDSGWYQPIVQNQTEGLTFKYGRDPDGTPTAAWSWSDLNDQRSSSV